ncbi:WcaG Nucleoside-diphosphate-sugar epimerases [Candidatus Methylopumilus universalis]|uniref:SDR family NAD(P)-dependent oxidoreductase n=1 Tax=Candidatus Methylopumilus universalis TaxID=2588536 RepID=UPI003BEEB2A9
MFANERVLITGGSGSLGRQIVDILKNSNEIVVYSRNEERQHEMQKSLGRLSNLTFIIGDVRDELTLTDALRGCTIAIHAAAMKDLIFCENQPVQTYLNNLIGTQSFLQAVKKNPSVKKACGVSTDKAASPSSVYGCTKYIMEQMFRESARYADCIMSTVRFGNMINSRGSLIGEWKSNPNKEICLTHPDVARFFFTVKDGATTVLEAINSAKNGELYIRKMKQARIYDILKLITGRDSFPIIGLFPGEKIHEELVSQNEAPYCHELGNYYVVKPECINKSPPQMYSTQNAPAFSLNELVTLLDF